MVFSNLWLLSGAVSAVLAGSYETDAIQRTTTAVTIFQAGFKENVIPGIAQVEMDHPWLPVPPNPGNGEPQDPSHGHYR
jgi:carboxypeptidase PM20D1